MRPVPCLLKLSQTWPASTCLSAVCEECTATSLFSPKSLFFFKLCRETLFFFFFQGLLVQNNMLQCWASCLNFRKVSWINQCYLSIIASNQVKNSSNSNPMKQALMRRVSSDAWKPISQLHPTLVAHYHLYRRLHKQTQRTKSTTY
jgi:hypothetical protein